MWRFGRAHHYVDYKPFRGNPLLRDPTAAPLPDYGLRLVDLADAPETLRASAAVASSPGPRGAEKSEPLDQDDPTAAPPADAGEREAPSA